MRIAGKTRLARLVMLGLLAAPLWASAAPLSGENPVRASLPADVDTAALGEDFHVQLAGHPTEV